jgi:outer membrane protein assembly factor BamA
MRTSATVAVWWFVIASSTALAQLESSPKPLSVTVRSVQLDDADSIPEAVTNVIRGQIAGNRFSKATLDVHSAGRVRQALYTYGFMEATVDPPTVKQADNDLVDLIFHIEPGTRYYVSGLALGGVEAFSPQQVRDLIPIHPGDPVDADKLHRALADIRHLYTCAGFLDADPEVSENYHRATRTLFYNVRMHEGEVSTITSVKVVGLDRGSVDKVITLPELQPKSVFSSCRIREAISALWPQRDSSSPLSFAVQAEQYAHRVDVLIDFSAGHAPRDEIHIISQQ